ncbi:hypothetical protein [Pseudomonas poae]|uniref:hypothetical protein n=1 Tax=Pseudomonas poae TaxID=200451 RepID=UPI0030D15716
MSHLDEHVLVEKKVHGTQGMRAAARVQSTQVIAILVKIPDWAAEGVKPVHVELFGLHPEFAVGQQRPIGQYLFQRRCRISLHHPALLGRHCVKKMIGCGDMCANQRVVRQCQVCIERELNPRKLHIIKEVIEPHSAIEKASLHFLPIA